MMLALILGTVLVGPVPAMADSTHVYTGEVIGHEIEDPFTVTGMSFSNTEAPTVQYANGLPDAALNMSKPYTTSVVSVTYRDGRTEDYPLEYKMLFRSDDPIQAGPHAGEYYGGIVNKGGTPVLDPVAANNPFYFDVTSKAIAAGLNPVNMDQLVADTPDGAALIEVDDAPESAATAQLSYLNHFEYVSWDGNLNSQYGKNPMFIGNSTVSQDLATGVLSVTNFDKLNFAGQKGLWIPCAASKSPWNTFIGSEEYEADQWNFDMNAIDPIGFPLDFNNSNLVEAFQVKFGDPTARPYDYGYVTEAAIDENGMTTPVSITPQAVGPVR